MVKKNEIYEIEVEELGNKGEGVGRIDGFTIFLPTAITGDIVRAKIVVLKKKYGIGKVIEIIKPSKDRVEPICKLFGICGGCQIMNMDYNAQLEMKREKVEQTLSRIGKINIKVNNTIGMKEPYEYRNKSQFPVGKIGENAIMGFYEMGSHKIVDTDYCHIQAPINEQILEVTKKYIKKYNIETYDEIKRKGLVRHIISRVGFVTGEVMVVIITNGRKLPYKDEFVEMLKESIPGLVSVVQNVNTQNTNYALGRETIILYGEDKIVDYIGDLKFNISSKSFYQVNQVQTKVLYDKTLKYAGLTGDEVVFDIYCGIGTISLFLAQNTKEVHGVEIVEEAIVDAKENAAMNNIKNARFYAGKAEEVVPKLYKEGLRADVVVVDPPRKGCDESVLETIVNMEPKKIVYVSCNPTTLARDLLYLSEKGYKTIEVQPVDMFPHTAHVEVVVKLGKP